MAREILKNAEIKSNYGVRADRTKARRDQLQALWVSADKFKRNGVNKKNGNLSMAYQRLLIVIVTLTTNMSVHSVSSQPSFNNNNENKIVETKSCVDKW